MSPEFVVITLPHTNDNGWLSYSANLPVKKTQCASTHHSCKYTHRHKHNLRLPTHIMVCLDLWKCLLKKESFELGSEDREGGEIPQAVRQQIPDSWGDETERTVTNRSETAFRDFQEFFIRWSESAWSLIRAERSWKVRGKCTVEVTVGKSCDLVFAAEFHRQPMEFLQQWCSTVLFSFFQNELSCTVLNPLQSSYLFCRQNGSLSHAVVKARGNQGSD